MKEFEIWIGNDANACRFDADDVENQPSPGTIWRNSSHLTLRAFAARLVDACVGSCDVERIHALNGRIRTKARNRLGYVRSQSSAFLHMHLQADQKPPGSDWFAAMKLLDKFDRVSDEDEKFLDEFTERIARAELKE